MPATKHVFFAIPALLASTIAASAVTLGELSFSGSGVAAYEPNQPGGTAQFATLLTVSIDDTLPDASLLANYSLDFTLTLNGTDVVNTSLDFGATTRADIAASGDPLTDGFVLFELLPTIDVSGGPVTGPFAFGDFPAEITTTVAGSNPATGDVLIVLDDNPSGDLLAFFGPTSSGGPTLTASISGSLLAESIAAIPLPASGLLLAGGVLLLGARRRKS